MRLLFWQLRPVWRWVCVGLLACWALPTAAQQAPLPTPAARFLALKLVPQHVVLSGYWVEVEYGLPRHLRQSVALTAQLYHGSAGRPNAPGYAATYPGEFVRGAGVELRHRLYLRPGHHAYPTGLYVSYGPNFQHFRMTYSGLGWREVKGPNGLEYLEYGRIPVTTTINRYGVAGVVGYQAPLPPGRVFLDLYVGVGWRHGHNQSDAVAAQFQSGTSDYGHQGFYFPAGVKVGVQL